MNRPSTPALGSTQQPAQPSAPRARRGANFSILATIGVMGLAGLASALVSPSSAFGQLIAYDGFAYPKGTPLTSVIPGGLGWVGNWNVASTGNWTVDAFGSTYVNAGLNLAQGGNRIMGTSAGLQRTLSLATPLGNSPQTVWVSFIAQQTLGATNQNWLGVKLPCAAGAGINSFLFMGKPYGKATWGLDAGSIGSHLVGSKSVFSKSFVVARIDMRAGLDDVRLWVNPPLGTTPTNATASVTALNYGNFQGITKAITEVGSISGLTTGNIDELRIGLAYESVAPIKPGRMFKGFQNVALGQGILENTSPDMLTVSNIGGTGNDGVEITLNSLSGSSIELGPSSRPPGSHQTITNKNWNGTIIRSTTLQRTAAGNYELVADFTGNPSGPVTSVRTVIRDSGGNVIQDTTTPGPIAGGNVNALIAGGNNGLCVDGKPPRWYLDEVIDPLNPSGGLVTTSVFGCPNGFMSDFNKNSVTFTANFSLCSGCTANPGGTNGTHTIDVTGKDIDQFNIGSLAADYHRASASGIGDAMISQSCTDGSACSDPALQHLTISNLGSSGNDGAVFKQPIKRPSAAVQTHYSIDFASSLAASETGQVVLSKTGLSQTNVSRTQHVVLTANGPSQASLALDLAGSGITQIRYTLSNNGELVTTGETSPGAFVCMLNWSSGAPGKKIINWIDYGFPWPFGGSWGHLDAEFENWGVFAITAGGGGGTSSGNELSIEFLNGDQIVSFDTLAVTGKDLASGTIDIFADNLFSVVCPADFNSDQQVDDADFVVFVGAYNILDCADPAMPSGCPADLNGDGWVDDADFVDFVSAYNLLLCP